MASFMEMRDLLLLSYESGNINDEEVTLGGISVKNPKFPCEQYPRFNLDDMNEAECLVELRFAKHDIPRLAEFQRSSRAFREQFHQE